jgi:hypothetical protein
MTISIVPISATVLADDGTAVVGADEFNAGYQKISQSAAGLIGKDSSGDSTLNTFSGATHSGTTITVSDATINTSDITTNNASTSKHGFLKKLNNDSTYYMDGSGAWSVPAGGGGGGSGLADSSYFRGGALSYSSTTAIAVADCAIALNGNSRSIAGATYTSGSTMKDIANSTVTLGASKAYFVFAFDNAGTGEIRFEEVDGTGDGAALTYDATKDYWKAASTGATARRIGKFWTNGSSQIIKFYMSGKGRARRVYINDRTAGPALLSGASSAAYAAVTITPYITADDEEYIARAILTTSGATSFSLNWSVDGGTSDHVLISSSSYAASTFEPGPYQWIVNTSSLQYKNVTCTVASRLLGFSFTV